MNNIINEIKRDAFEYLKLTNHKMKKPFNNNRMTNWERIPAIESIIINSHAHINHKQHIECPVYGYDDVIDMPLKDGFTNSFGYYAIVLHELGHWTARRVNRKIPSYAYEELVADFVSWILIKMYHVPNFVKEFYSANLNEYLGDNNIDDALNDAIIAVNFLLETNHD